MSLFASTLIDWYAHHGRELPWRGTHDPYLIWVSEIILQQTRVAQGYDYFLRFVRRFPDVQSLAAATEDEVMRYWQGLGYYSRARNLHRAARSMADGRFPTTYDEVRALPGVGDYTAAAICSLAYGMPRAVVDGNVYRVVARYLGIDTPIDTTEGRRTFARMAQEQMDTHRPAAYNQAVMDFGAMVCTPRNPMCADCPLTETCEARRQGTVNSLPVRARRTTVTDRYLYYFFIADGAYTYIRKRTAGDIWRGLYELPLIETETSRPADELPLMYHASLADVFGSAAELTPVVVGARHVLTHRVLHASLHRVTLAATPTDATGYLRIPIVDLQDYAFPVLLQRFLRAASASG